MRINKYLKEKLTPLIDEISVSMTDSLQLKIFGIEDDSKQSILIQMGNVWETFWNTVFSEYATNLLENGNLIKVDGKNRQIDHLFSSKQNGDILYYFESKCNLNFDSEKTPASNRKVMEVSETIEKENPNKKTLHGYFIPCVIDVSPEMIKRYKHIKLYGVRDVLSIIDGLPFTLKEFEYYLQTEGRKTFYKKYRWFWETNDGRQELIDFLEKKGYTVSKKKKPKIKT